jgi:hypothetical protein
MRAHARRNQESWNSRHCCHGHHSQSLCFWRQSFCLGLNQSACSLRSSLCCENRFCSPELPEPTCRNLFPATEPPQAASPSIRRYLTNAASSILPTCCGPLNFPNNQVLFDAIFLTNDRKPIFNLLSPRASLTTTISTVDVETAIQACLSEC